MRQHNIPDTNNFTGTIAMSVPRWRVRVRDHLLQSAIDVSPKVIGNRVLSSVLNHLLRSEIEGGECSFIENGTIYIRSTQPNLCVRIVFQRQHFHCSKIVPTQLNFSNDTQQQVLMSAHATDFIALLLREIDPDTLFFQRRLKLQGNTELGLGVKNLLDGIDLERIPKPLIKLLLSFKKVIELT